MTREKVQIAYVDDQPSYGIKARLDSIESLNKIRGYDFEVFIVPERFMAKVQKGYRPDLILMDTELNHEVKGYEWARKIKEIYDCRVIGLSYSEDYKGKWNEMGFPFVAKMRLALGDKTSIEQVIENILIKSKKGNE